MKPFEPVSRWVSEPAVREHMRAAYCMASLSHDRSTQNGAIIFATNGKSMMPGWNRFSQGFDHSLDELHERPLKYDVTIHAEASAICFCASHGRRAFGSLMVACWAACPSCALLIVESGISMLVVHKDRMDATPERWKPKVELGLQILDKGGVDVRYIEGTVNAGFRLLFDGQTIEV